MELYYVILYYRVSVIAHLSRSRRCVLVFSFIEPEAEGSLPKTQS